MLAVNLVSCYLYSGHAKKLRKVLEIMKKKSFKQVLVKIESSQDLGKGSWDLPENPTPSQLVKYELCEKVSGYQEDNNLSDKEITKRINPKRKIFYFVVSKRSKEK